MATTSTATHRWQDVVRFADLLLRSAERDPEHEAVVFPDALLTYGELERRASRNAPWAVETTGCATSVDRGRSG